LCRVAILQSNYIPWKGYFDLINTVDIFVFYDEVQFTKNDWRNRNIIKNATGQQWLTIPVIQKNLDQKIDNTIIAHSLWIRKHKQAIELNYRKSKYFDEVFPIIEDLYQIENDNLSLINQKLILNINKLLELETKIINSTELSLKGDKVQRLVHACKKLNATTYVSGPRAKEYLDETLFHQNRIQVEWKDYSNYDDYSQLHQPFNHNVSIIDTLMNLGIEKTQQYIKNGCRNIN
jgi:hypothetical protein